MFLIQNISGRELALGDLRVSLKPGQKIDLDKTNSRYVTEGSTALQVSIRKNFVKVLKKDAVLGAGSPPKKVKKIKTKEKIIVQNAGGVDNKDLQAMEKRMDDRFKKQLAKQLAKLEGDGKVVQAEVDTGSLEKLVGKIGEMVESAEDRIAKAADQAGSGTDEEAIAKAAAAAAQAAVESVISKIPQGAGGVIESQAEDVAVDEETLSEMHARAVDKRTTDVKATISHDEDEGPGTDISDRASELEGLL